ncbi:sialic acid synthase [Psychromonas marina]|uniref:Sialic acid synthase n=1 Tax=Psychromonas marina TaxID=88364 RepID=A0ABQ6DVC3_9GAMM|nr:acetyltransferase [Psychromonas marina]GLS89035.1 sialic acid synthase [Psychromonas marina]
MGNKIVVLGAGGHASVLVDILKQNQHTISGIFSPDIDFVRSALVGIPFFENENKIFEEQCNTVSIVNGLGSLPGSNLRTKLYKKFTKQGYSFQQVVSKHACISDFAILGKGVQVMPGAIIQAGAVIGDNSIINTGAIIEHDCIIGAHNHIAPGATLSGQVKTGDYVHIGTGANIIQCISIGDKAVIGAGAIVTKHVPFASTVFGARTVIHNKRLDNES